MANNLVTIQILCEGYEEKAYKFANSDCDDGRSCM